MTTTLALAGRLRAMPDDALTAALRTRSIRRSGVTDFFDLAEALLEADSLQRALVALDRVRLAALAVLGRASGPMDAAALAAAVRDHPATAGLGTADASRALDDLSALLLVHPEGAGFAPYDAVSARLAAWPEAGLPSADELLGTPPPAPGPAAGADPGAERLAAERGFESVAAVSELLAELSREGARELQKGGLALPAVKRLAEALAVDASVVPTALSVALRARLVALDGGVWLPTEEAAAWLRASTRDRWRALAGAWLGALPPDVRLLLGARSRTSWGAPLQEHAAWLHPASAEEARSRLDDRLREAAWLGLAVADAPSPAGTTLLDEGAEAAAATMSAGFPAEVDRVYLQHDLTIVSPGPLAPSVEARLRGMADLESRALASTFRLSPASIDRALTAGETVEGIRAFLGEVSLTGLPQPIDYVVTDAAERHGRVRVRDADGGGARSAVHSPDPTLLRTIAVDQALASLRLAPGPDGTLLSRFPRDVVFWALADARYPVLAEDAEGRPVTLRRQRLAHPRPAEQRDQDAELVARLRDADREEEGDAAGRWLARQLDQAVRARQTVLVEVALPDGRVIDWVMEPTGVGGGRLRGRDRAADIERTVPLSSVRGVRPAE